MDYDERQTLKVQFSPHEPAKAASSPTLTPASPAGNLRIAHRGS
jgi:hypothetical protein